mmetsp:Transcript_15540/g.36606  ORF Transcript_15540/g.36606 Transcript_15540/m.36606 type:complete len:492 (-) Transcript_15540:91-1566(-)
MSRADLGTEASQQSDAVLVQLALSRHDRITILLFAEVAVDDGRHRIYAKTIDVEVFDPVVRGPKKVRLDLRLGVVVAGCAPPWDLSHRTLILVLREAGVLHEAPLILGKVGSHKIHEHANVVAVQRVNQISEIIRGTQSPVHGIEASSTLVAPRLLARILGQRQELDCREAHFRHMLRQGLGEGAIGQPVRALHPTSQMHLVDREWLLAPRCSTKLRLPVCDPCVIRPGVGATPCSPAVVVALRDFGIMSTIGGVHKLQGIGICFDHRFQSFGHYLVGILLATQVPRGHEQFPNSKLVPAAHRVGPSIPKVEVPHQAHRMGTRSPHGKARAPESFLMIAQLHMMSTEHGGCWRLGHASGKAGKERLRQQGSQRMLVGHRAVPAAAELDVHFIVPPSQLRLVFSAYVLKGALEKPRALGRATLHRMEGHLSWGILARVTELRYDDLLTVHDRDGLRPTDPTPEHDVGADDLHSEDVLGVGVLAIRQQVDVII